jgi:hypothetical protein
MSRVGLMPGGEFRTAASADDAHEAQHRRSGGIQSDYRAARQPELGQSPPRNSLRKIAASATAESADTGATTVREKRDSFRLRPARLVQTE